MDVKEAVKKVCTLAKQHVTRGQVERARERQGAVLAWREPDYLPLLMTADLPELHDLPTYNWAEQFHDPAKSFVMQMRAVVNAAAARADCLPCLRADTGVINGPSIFGVECIAPEHTKPVVSKPQDKRILKRFRVPEDIADMGIMMQLIQHTQHHLCTLEDYGLSELVDVHHCDTQGPFDIAHQVRGPDIFTDIYDDPDFFHHLMNEATRCFIQLSKFSKGMAGEGNWGNASGYWMESGGIRICEDSAILLSAECYVEHIRRYNEQALNEFEGGWIHYCGSVPGTGRPGGEHLHDIYIELSNLRGLNFTTSGDLDAEIRKLVNHDVAYIGSYPRDDGESLDDYFRRLLRLLPQRTGLLLQSPPIKPNERDAAYDTWYKIQDEVFG